MAKFFTWVEVKYSEPAEVPDRVIAYLRKAWLAGSSVEELSFTFDLPVEWVDDFVRREIREPKPN
jgi:hypothetical protein